MNENEQRARSRSLDAKIPEGATSTDVYDAILNENLTHLKPEIESLYQIGYQTYNLTIKESERTERTTVHISKNGIRTQHGIIKLQEAQNPTRVLTLERYQQKPQTRTMQMPSKSTNAAESFA